MSKKPLGSWYCPSANVAGSTRGGPAPAQRAADSGRIPLLQPHRLSHLRSACRTGGSPRRRPALGSMSCTRGARSKRSAQPGWDSNTAGRWRPTGGTAFCKHTGEQQGGGAGPHPAPPPTPTEGLAADGASAPGPLPWELPPDMKP